MIALKYFLVSPYSSVLRYQESLFDKAVEAKNEGQEVQQTLILCQHHPVYTLGKSGSIENLLVDPEEVGAEFVRINRGGDITFHGPGQLVAYPIVDLDKLGIGVALYVENLEDVIIKTLADFGVIAERMEGAPGVWVNGAKIGAVGIKLSRHITMHGLALNINTDLSFFDHIVPCGISDKQVTSMMKLSGSAYNMIDVVNVFKKYFQEVFNEKLK
jgi:lipoyl(octanoyl) transferase